MTQAVTVNAAEDVRPLPLRTFTEGYALIIGVGQDVPFTAHNAAWLGDILTNPERGGYLKEHVVVLAGRLATRDAILQNLEEFKKKVPTNSTFLFFFSGHGDRVTGPPGRTYYLLPYGHDLTRPNETLISSEELKRCFADFKVAKLAVVLDCCHAGGVPNPFPDVFRLDEMQPQPSWFQGRRADADFWCLCATREDQKAYDARLHGKPCSAFVAALLEALCGQASDNQAPEVSVNKISDYCIERVPDFAAGQIQEPVAFGGGEFPLAFHSGGRLGPRGIPLGNSIYASLDGLLKVEPYPGVFLDRHRRKERIKAALRKTLVRISWIFPVALLASSSWDNWIYPSVSVPNGIEIESINDSGIGDATDGSAARSDVKGYISTISTRRFFASSPELRVFACIDGDCGPPSMVNANGTWLVPDVFFRKPGETPGRKHLQIKLEESSQMGSSKYLYSRVLTINIPVPAITLTRVCGHKITADTRELSGCASLEFEGTVSNLFWDSEQVCVYAESDIIGPLISKTAQINYSGLNGQWRLWQGKPLQGPLEVRIGIVSTKSGSGCMVQYPAIDKTFQLH